MRAAFSILLVEDDAPLRETIAAVLLGMSPDDLGQRETPSSKRRGARSVRVESVGSLAEVRALDGHARYELLLLDFVLPDGTGTEVLALLEERGPLPITIAISGEAGPEEAFLLAQKGVRAFLRKPFGLREFQTTVRQVLSASPDPLPLVRGTVGKRPLAEVEEEVRETMVKEALARAQGSVRGAATLLGISRQMLGHILKKSR